MEDKERIIICNQDNKECDNMNMDNCKDCKAPLFCQCKRPEVKKMVEYLWLESNSCRKKRGIKPENRYIQFGPGQIPAPETEKPNIGGEYFCLESKDRKENGYTNYTWDHDQYDTAAFKNGIWLKEEHIQEVVAVIRGIMGGERRPE